MKVAPILEHEEGVTSSLTLAPPYYVYTSLLSAHPPKFPKQKT